MGRRVLTVLAVAGVLCLLASSAAMAASVYGTDVGPGDLADSRYYPAGGLKLVSGSGDPEGATVAWEITQNGAMWDYIYTFTDFGQGDISHVTFDCSDAYASSTSGLIVGNIIYVTTPYGSSTSTLEWTNGGTMDGIFGAFKTASELGDQGLSDGGFLELAFTSTNAPMWGDMYIKDGQFYEVANLYWQDHNPADSIAGYIAVPDTDTYIPEPSTIALLCMGGTGLLPVLRRRKRA
jgi:hypothetical protein